MEWNACLTDIGIAGMCACIAGDSDEELSQRAAGSAQSAQKVAEIDSEISIISILHTTPNSYPCEGLAGAGLRAQRGAVSHPERGPLPQQRPLSGRGRVRVHHNLPRSRSVRQLLVGNTC